MESGKTGKSGKRTAAKRNGNVPAAVEPFLGRTEVLTELQQRLSTSRMVTLTGVGGGGKTRLAFELAAQMQDSGAYADGVWIAELDWIAGLDSVNDPDKDPDNDLDMLLQAVLSAVDAPDQVTREPLPTLLAYLQDKEMLLVLDNCEHLMPATSKLATTLLRAAPGLRIVATSRTQLGSLGETVVAVQPMTLPALNAPMPAPPYAEYEAVEMFWTLVEASVPNWTITEDNWPHVVQILHGVDGIPLAIKLMTVRLRSMSIEALVDRLDDLFKLLNRNDFAPTHHETLDAVFRWNFNECSDAQKLVWARVSTFAHTFTLRAAEEVCADEELPQDQIIDALTGLVETSTVETDEWRKRYRLLAPLRQFGAKLLKERGEQEVLLQRRRDFYLSIVARAAADWYGEREYEILDEIAADLPNFRAVMSAYIAAPDAQQSGLRMALALGRTRVYFYLGLMREGISWLNRTLDATPVVDPELEIAARATDLFIDSAIGADEERVRPRLQRVQAIADKLAHPAPPIWFATGMTFLWLDGDRGGLPLLDHAYDAFRSAGPDTYGDAAMALMLRAVGEALTGNYEQAATAAARLTDDTESARAPWMIRWAHWCETIVEARFGDPARATERLERLLRERTEVADNWLPMWLVEVLAWATAKTGNARRAAMLLGAVSALNELTGIRVQKLQPFLGHHREAEATAERLLGTPAYRTAFAIGARVTSTSEARALALSTGKDDSPWSLLTAAQQEVARLIGQGLSNEDVAARRFVSVRTVDAQLRDMRRKLDLDSTRGSLVTWALTHDPLSDGVPSGHRIA